jgi:hypothetical protein
MTYDDSVQIAWTSLAQRPALARTWRSRKRRVSRRSEPSLFPAVAGRAEDGLGVTTETEIFRLAKP